MFLKKLSKIAVPAMSVFLLSHTPLAAQDFDGNDYDEAAWMVTRFYGGQRSGEGPNWLLQGFALGDQSFTQDAYNGADMAGGWFDCGDHAMFGQTQFFSAYMLAKAYYEFPSGFKDYYSTDYSGYQTSGNYNEKTAGTPNGIPDILDELKYVLDFFVKVTPNNSTFIYQKGNGNFDHATWNPAPQMSKLDPSQGGEPRDLFADPNDASMPSLAAAALALGSIVLREHHGDAYANSLLQHAIYAYEYAGNHPGTVGSATGNFYPVKPKWGDSYVIAGTELYKATGEDKYLDDAKAKVNLLSDHGYSLNYNNIDDLAFYNLAAYADHSSAWTEIEKFMSKYKNAAGGEGGLSNAGDPQWGTLRFPANQAFFAALYAKLSGENQDDFIFDQIDYILGSNNAKQSFVVGFCQGCNKKAEKPHHRNVYMKGGNPADPQKNALVIPEKNKKFGALVGGTRTSSSYKSQEKVTDYVVCEVCIDYNAGLVGSLGYAVSQNLPNPVQEPVFEKPSQLNFQYSAGKAEFSSMRNKAFTVHIYDMNGIQVWQKRSMGTSLQWNARKNGVYFFTIEDAHATRKGSFTHLH